MELGHQFYKDFAFYTTMDEPGDDEATQELIQALVFIQQIASYAALRFLDK